MRSTEESLRRGFPGRSDTRSARRGGCLGAQTLHAVSRLFPTGYLDDEGEAAEEQRAHYSRAAQLYRTYAMRACDSRFDLKVTFGGSGRANGERVDMSERALRRCITLYGVLASTNMVNQVYSAYYKLMKTISAKAWEPSKETLQDLQGAQAQTNAYRFLIRVMSHESSPLHLETDGSS